METICFNPYLSIQIILQGYILSDKRSIWLSLLLDKKVKKVSRKSKSLLSEVYEVCYLKNLGPEHSKYNSWHKELSEKLRDRFCKIEKRIQGAVLGIFRDNFLVENVNGRLSNYFTLRREVWNEYLSFMQFFQS